MPIILQTNQAPSDRERNVAVAIHLIILIIPFLTGLSPGLMGMLVAGIAVSTDPMKSEFVSGHARQSFYFHALWLIGMLVLVLGFGLNGLSSLWFIFWVAYTAVGGWRARRGLDYPLPWQWG